MNVPKEVAVKKEKYVRHYLFTMPNATMAEVKAAVRKKFGASMRETKIAELRRDLERSERELTERIVAKRSRLAAKVAQFPRKPLTVPSPEEELHEQILGLFRFLDRADVKSVRIYRDEHTSRWQLEYEQVKVEKVTVSAPAQPSNAN